MKRKLAVLFGIFTILSIPFQLWIETQHRSDSLGLWYTIYCSLINAGILTAAVVVIGYPIRRYLKYKQRRKGVE